MQRPQPPKLVAVALLCADIKSHLIIANFTFTVKDAEVGARQRGDELFAELVQRPIAPMTPAANDDDELRKRREAAEPLPLRGVVWGVCCMVLYSCMLIQRCMALYGAVWLYGAGGKA